MKMKEFNPEVFYSDEDYASVDRHGIDALKKTMLERRCNKIRLCCHGNIQDSLHEMVIIQSNSSYVQPHKHVDKSESFHIIKGSLAVVIFDNSGKISEHIVMGESISEKVFYYRMSKENFHTVIPISQFVVFHETTNGPFDPSQTIFASWAPSSADQVAAKNYVKSLKVLLGLGLE